MRGLLLMGLGLVATPAVAQEAVQFDLVCRAQFREAGPNDRRREEIRYRIDLDRMKWCMRGCDNQRDIALVSDSQITLTRPVLSLDGAPTEDHSINRRNGEIRYVYSSRQRGFDMRGNCRREEFSGFPDQSRMF